MIKIDLRQWSVFVIANFTLLRVRKSNLCVQILETDPVPLPKTSIRQLLIQNFPFFMLAEVLSLGLKLCYKEVFYKQVFSCEYWEIFKNNFFHGIPR